MISVVTVSFNSDDFALLLIESLERFSSDPYELVLVDNSYTMTEIHRNHKNVRYFRGETDHSHGSGINIGVMLSQGNFVLILDNDCHLLAKGYEAQFLHGLGDHHCLTVQGPPEKPIRPACLFMRRDHALAYDWRATPGYKGHRITPEGFDVGIAAYNSMIEHGHSIRYMTSNRDAGLPNRYGTANGEEYGLDVPLVYHHWHGTHLDYRQRDYPNVDLASDKKKLFLGIPWRTRPVTLI